MRRIWLPLLLLALPLSAVTVDRVAAVVDRQVLTVSEITQMIEIRFFTRTGSSEDEFRREVLDALVLQILRQRDVERFGAQDISLDAIEARLQEVRMRFASEEEFEAALERAELTIEEVQALVKRQLQVEAYIQERFAPLIFVTSEEIEEYYRTIWSAQRRQRGLAVPPLARVQDEVRLAIRSSRLENEVNRWTAQLRARANVDIYAWR